MANIGTSRGRAQDRAKVAGGQDHEVRYEAGKTGAIRKTVASRLAGRRQPTSFSATGSRARATCRSPATRTTPQLPRRQKYQAATSIPDFSEPTGRHNILRPSGPAD